MEKKLSLIDENYSLLEKRFPKVAFLSNLQNIFSNEKKYIDTNEERFFSFEDKPVDLIYIYGIDITQYSSISSWLKEDKKRRKVVFLEDDLFLFSKFLNSHIGNEILKNNQIHLCLLDDNMDMLIEELAYKFPYDKIDVQALDCKDKNDVENLKLKIFSKTTLSNAIFSDKKFSGYLFSHFIENAPKLISSCYVNKLRDICKDIPLVVCGSGPSLQSSLSTLSELKDHALIIAGGSSISALSNNDVSLDIGVTIDPNEEEYNFLKQNQAFEIPFFYCNRLYPQIFSISNSIWGYMRCVTNQLFDFWLEESLGLNDDLIGQDLLQESFSVTLLNLSLAKFLGCKKIILCGVDLSYPHNNRYVNGINDEKTNEKTSFVYKYPYKIKNNNNENITTNVLWMMEQKTISSFAKLNPTIQIFNASDEALTFENISCLSLSEFKDRFCKKQIDITGLLHSSMQMVKESKDASKQLKKIKISISEVIKHINIMLFEINLLEESKKAFYETGKMSLAKIEMEEEEAYKYLFYDFFNFLLEENREKYQSELEVYKFLWLEMKKIATSYEKIMEKL